MSNRDFASKPKSHKPRGGASRTGSSARKTPASPQPSGVSAGLVLAVFVALGLLAGLIYFLIKQPAPSSSSKAIEQAPTQEPVIPAQVEPRQPGESLPLDNIDLESQDERFGFYKLLEESEVKTPEESAYVSTPKTASLDAVYRLQTGSFRNARDAEAQRARLALSGLPNVTMSRTEGSNGVWYRVSTGNFSTYNELKSATAKLEKLNIHPVKRKVN